MKKTISISLNNTLFHVEEDAYEKLSSYLASIRVHFAANPDRDEILRDIEARIAERFSDKGVSVVILQSVEELIAAMGTVEQFDEPEEGADTAQAEKTKTRKRLYRDTDEAVLAGISAGLGHYFGIDPVIVRAIFLVSLLVGGTGILVYLIFWLAVPEAKTPAEKLAMKGEAVTLSSVSELVKEKVEKFNKSDTPKKIIFFPITVLRGVANFLQRVVFPAIRIIIGAVLLITSIALVIGVTVLAGIILSGVPAVFIPIPVVQGALLYIGVTVVYFAITIPAIILFLFGLGIVRKKRIVSRQIWISLIVIWLVAILGTAIVGSKIAVRIEKFVREEPQFLTSTETIPVTSFSELVVRNGKQVTLVQGEKTEVTVTGRQIDLDYLEVESNNGVLTIDSKNKTWPCFFCGGHPTQITVTTPTIAQIAAENASLVTGTFNTEKFSLTLKNASTAELITTAKEVTIKAENTSHALISGSAENLTVTLANASRLDAQGLKANMVTISAENASQAVVMPLQTLSVVAENGSNILYSGTPRITTEELRNGSTLKKSE